MAYIIRDADGVMHAKITNSHAKYIMDNFSGVFKTLKYKSGNKLVFIIQDDAVLSTDSYDIYIWSDYRLIPE